MTAVYSNRGILFFLSDDVIVILVCDSSEFNDTL